MSFTVEIKKKLCGIIPKKKCCSRAVADGMALCALPDTNGGGASDVINIGASDDEIASFASNALSDRFRCEVNIETSLSRGRRSDKLIIAGGIPGSLRNQKAKFTCPDCMAAYLRGMFIVCGSVSDPESGYHAELLFKNADAAKIAYEVLADAGCVPKIINRKNAVGLYYKSESGIEDLLMTLGAKSSAFDMMNGQIKKTIRNNENRVTNCVASNISKTVDAARRQIADIEELERSGRLEAMPYDIRVTAKLRRENPGVSLDELAGMHTPPLSKSGLNHRLAKISEEAHKIIKK